MFGIGLPEFILILALALIVVGPDKLPDLARSVAKGILELKKTANTLKESLNEHGNPLDEIKPELEDAARAMKDDIIGDVNDGWEDSRGKKDDSTKVIDVEPEHSDTNPPEESENTKKTEQTEQKN